MNPQPPRDRRAFYRLRYPFADRPKVRFNDCEYTVIEISERGARILYISGSSNSIPSCCEGSIQFTDGETVDIVGNVIWSDEREIAIGLSKGISLQRMVREQARLRKKYPLLLDSGGKKNT